MKRTLFILILTLFCFLSQNIKQAGAAEFYDVEGYYTNLNNSIIWQVASYLIYNSTNGAAYTFYVAGGGSSIVSLWTNTDTGCPSSATDHLRVHWMTSCVDPLTTTTVVSSFPILSGTTLRYACNLSDISVSCPSSPHCGDSSGNYLADNAACRFLDDHGQTVNLTDVCPQTGTVHYCAENGHIYGSGTCAYTCDTGTKTCNGCHTASQNYCNESSSISNCLTHTVTDNSCTTGCVTPTPTPPPTGPTPTLPPVGTCTAGTGHTNSSCGPEATIVSYSLNSSGVCCGDSWGCHGGNSCVLACHDINVSSSLCPTVTPPPSTCQECIGSSCQTYSTSNCNTSCGSGCSTPPGTCP